MAILEIDLNVKQLPETTHIWRLFPGKYYSLLDGFIQQSAVYFEMPSMFIEGGEFKRGDNSLPSRIARSRRIDAWIAKRRLYDVAQDGGTPPQEPSRDLAEYQEIDPNADYSQSISLIARLFGTAQKGDLVIVPSPGRTRQVRVGEIVDDARDENKANLGEAWLNEQTAARKVRWSSVIAERRLPTALALTFRTQNTLIEIPHEYYEQLFDVTYGSYFTEGQYASRFSTGSSDFDDQDNLDIGILLRLASSAASDFTNGKTIQASTSDILSRTLPDKDKVSLSFDINSPGFLNAHAKTIAPLLLSALLTVFMVSDANAEPPSQVRIVNSGGGDERCVADVNSAVAATLRARFGSHGAGSRLRFGWTERWSMRRIMARVTMASDTSGRCS